MPTDPSAGDHSSRDNPPTEAEARQPSAAPVHRMRKAIMLDVRVWIEGEDEPAHDWAASTSAAIRDVLAAGAATHPELKITVKRVRELSG